MKNRGQLPLTALRAFEVTGRQRSLKLACQELHLTSGALSQQVRTLEDRIGVQLFDRANGRYELTPVGSKLLMRLTHSFDEIENALHDATIEAEPKRLRIKLAPTFAVRWLAPRFLSFFASNPGVDLEITTISSTTELTFDKCDFLVQFGAPPWTDLDSILLFHDELVPVCSPELARKLSSPTDLTQHVLLNSALREDSWPRWMRTCGMDTEYVYSSVLFPNAALACEAAASGSGIAITQLEYVRADLESGRLVAPFKQRCTSEKGYYMTSSRFRREEQKIRDFRNWINSLIAA